MPLNVLNSTLGGRPGAFLDRDGVLNVDHGYVCEVDRLEWVPGAREAVDLLVDRGYAPVVVTNQSGVGRGLFTQEALDLFHETFAAELPLAAIAWCPHVEADGCDCRKPKPGMIEEAIQSLDLRRAESFLIGDRMTDVIAARAAGIPGHRFSGGNLLSFVRAILG